MFFFICFLRFLQNDNVGIASLFNQL